MRHINYFDLSPDQKELFFEFLKKNYLEKKPASSNMWDDDWQSKPNTLPYILEKTNRFHKGIFFVLFDNKKIAACSGVHESEFNTDLVIAGVRTWVDREYRNKNIMREYMLPNEKLWSIGNSYKAIALTFNEYNKNLIKIWNKRRLGENRSPKKPYHFGYNNLTTVNFPVCIQNTKQYVLYEKLTTDFEFDWKNIKYPEELPDL